MVLVEGGPFHCHIHDFETLDLDEWNNHLTSTENGHRDTGLTNCVNCGTRFRFDIPAQPIDPKDGSKHIALICNECTKKYPD